MESAPINYGEQTTEELLALLVSEEDRVTEAHIRELAARPAALETLTKWLSDKDHWIEAEYGEWWGLYHAFTILSLTGKLEFLDTVLAALKYATTDEFDWICEASPAALAQFGPAGVERMMQFVKEERPKLSRKRDENFYSALDHMYAQQGITNYFDGGDTTHWRSCVCTALTRIGLAHPSERLRIAEFLCACLNDPAETDQTFLAFIVDDALVLDRELALAPIRAAFERNALDITVTGNFEKTIEHFDKGEKEQYFEFTRGLLEFYAPEEIAKRQERWEKEEEEDDDDDELNLDKLRQILENSPLRKPLPHQGFDAHHPTAPAGYKENDDGAFVRASAKVGRNDPCPCGSGKKYKKCCGKE